MYKIILGFLFLVFANTAFSSDFKVGDTVLDNYGGLVQQGTILDITSGGLVKTTNTVNKYIKMVRLTKYVGVKTYRAGNFLTGYRIYNVGDLVFDTFANTTLFGSVSMWNMGQILDLTVDGLVKTSNTDNVYIDISRLEKYVKVSSYKVTGWSGSTVFHVGDTVIDNFGGTNQASVIEDISSNGMVRTTDSAGKYIKIDRLQTK